MKLKSLKIALIIPCYNEEECLYYSIKLLANKIKQLIQNKIINKDSFMLFINDGSTDHTWEIIQKSRDLYHNIHSINLASNVGHQMALFCGLMHVKNQVDCSISIDADLQDDIDKIDEMIIEHQKGYEIVLGVRTERKNDNFFKRNTANLYYYLLNKIEIKITPNHADYRLMGQKAIASLSLYQEKSLFLRGLIHQLGFATTNVYYSRKKRIQGKSKYSLKKMISLAWSGITSLSLAPLRITFVFSLIIMATCFGYLFYALYKKITGHTIPGWTSTILPIYFFGGLQFFFIGLLGEYIGKIFKETLNRPRYLIKDIIENPIHKEVIKQEYNNHKIKTP